MVEAKMSGSTEQNYSQVTQTVQEEGSCLHFISTRILCN